MVIDEAWWMMKSEDTASFLLSIAKRGRKYYPWACHDHPGRGRLLQIAVRHADSDELVHSDTPQTVADFHGPHPAGLQSDG